MSTLVLAVAMSVTAQEAAPTVPDFSNDDLVHVIIGFDRTPGDDERSLVADRAGSVSFSYELIPAVAASFPRASLPDAPDPTEAVRAHLNSPRVTRVALDQPLQITDDELDLAWGVQHIGAGDVHALGITGAGVKVAVLDTGIDYNHADLDDNYVGGYNFVHDNDDPFDDHGHGTHVSGTIAAEDNGFGVVGVAPDAELYALKVCDAGGSGCSSRTIAALEWCVENGIQVTNHSYGRTNNDIPFLEEAFIAAYDAGLVMIASAGNSGNGNGQGDNVKYPARWPMAVAVAATNSDDQRANFSSTGPDVEIAAPGVGVISSTLGGDYGSSNGTSMSSPHVAGVAVLIIAAGLADENDDGRINDELRAVLTETAIDLGDPGHDPLFGYGLVDAFAAVDAVSPNADVNGDGVIDVVDLVQVILDWGPCPEGPVLCPADVTGDEAVDVADLVEVMLGWS